MKKAILTVLSLILLLLPLTACGADSASTAADTPSPTATSTPAPTQKPTAAPSAKSTSFTNKFGTSKTICAHSGCSSYIASSGDTNCCPAHSNKCLTCGCYIDEDAAWCMSCLSKAANSSKSSYTSYPSSSSSSSGGLYYCMGKNDTCPNKTNSPYDLYCSSCDPNNDNIEG